jgi:uncharacterized protein (DUF1015 family)
MKNAFRKIGIHIPSILLPSPQVDLKKWCVVACDQYTSQPEYWEEVEKIVGDDPSTLHLIFPEVYLEDGDSQERIEKITENMKKYMEEQILVPSEPGFILVERETSSGLRRLGLMVALDLEFYSYERDSQTLIRATEGTVVDRIPPRLKIREGALIEAPHIMVLIDDPENTVIEPMAEQVDKGDKLYDVELMLGAGSVKGYAIREKALLEQIYIALEKLADPKAFQEKYHVGPDQGVLLYAMGDGNHSLATAKAYWENIKATLSDDEALDHPARFALVELVNVYDAGLDFEPIHRVLFNVNPKEVLEAMVSYYEDRGCRALFNFSDESATPESHCHTLPFIFRDKYGIVMVENPRHNLEVGTLQNFLDYYIESQEGIRVDYVHGEDVVQKLSSKPGNLGFILPPMDKHDLFKTVIMEGVLPRKTFSMGESEDKRFYLECRKIVKE